MNRLFFAIDISPSDKEKLAHWRQQILTSFHAKPVYKDNFHITLAFLGGVNTKQQHQLVEFCDQLISTSSNATQYSVNFDRLELFNKAKVLCLGCQHFPDALCQLADALSKQAQMLNIFQEHRQYHPHISLYRKSTYRPDIENFTLTVKLSHFSLYLSQSTPAGVIYTPIKTWRLTKI